MNRLYVCVTVYIYRKCECVLGFYSNYVYGKELDARKFECNLATTLFNRNKACLMVNDGEIDQIKQHNQNKSVPYKLSHLIYRAWVTALQYSVPKPRPLGISDQFLLLSLNQCLR